MFQFRALKDGIEVQCPQCYAWVGIDQEQLNGYAPIHCFICGYHTTAYFMRDFLAQKERETVKIAQGLRRGVQKKRGKRRFRPR